MRRMIEQPEPELRIAEAVPQAEEVETLEVLLARLASDTFSAERIVAMARLNYVRCLLTLTGAGGRKSDGLIPQARAIAASTLAGVINLPISPAQIAVLIGSDDEDDKPAEPPPTPNRAKM